MSFWRFLGSGLLFLFGASTALVALVIVLDGEPVLAALVAAIAVIAIAGAIAPKGRFGSYIGSTTRFFGAIWLLGALGFAAMTLISAGLEADEAPPSEVDSESDGQAEWVDAELGLITISSTTTSTSTTDTSSSTQSPSPPPSQGAQPKPADAQGHTSKRYVFDHEGSSFYIDIQLSNEFYEYFRELERPIRHVRQDGETIRQHAYDVYVSAGEDDEMIDAIADDLLAVAHREGLDDNQALSLALSFVQDLQYTSDSVTTGFDEYPRYPLETLMDEGGDCEDTSILYASLVEAMGFGAIMIAPPGHMAAGVLADDDYPGSYYTVDGQRYMYAETTGQGWEIGESPPEHKGQKASIFKLDPRPAFHFETEYGDVEGTFRQVILTAEQLGSADAYNVRLFAGLHVGSDRYRDNDQCQWERVEPLMELTCEIWLDFSSVARGERVQIVTKVSDADYLQQRHESTWITPRP